jgi:hypothetical protein
MQSGHFATRSGKNARIRRIEATALNVQTQY